MSLFLLPSDFSEKDQKHELLKYYSKQKTSMDCRELHPALSGEIFFIHQKHRFCFVVDLSYSTMTVDYKTHQPVFQQHLQSLVETLTALIKPIKVPNYGVIIPNIVCNISAYLGRKYGHLALIQGWHVSQENMRDTIGKVITMIKSYQREKKSTVKKLRKRRNSTEMVINSNWNNVRDNVFDTENEERLQKYGDKIVSGPTPFPTCWTEDYSNSEASFEFLSEDNRFNVSVDDDRHSISSNFSENGTNIPTKVTSTPRHGDDTQKTNSGLEIMIRTGIQIINLSESSDSQGSTRTNHLLLITDASCGVVSAESYTTTAHEKIKSEILKTGIKLFFIVSSAKNQYLNDKLTVHEQPGCLPDMDVIEYFAKSTNGAVIESTRVFNHSKGNLFPFLSHAQEICMLMTLQSLDEFSFRDFTCGNLTYYDVDFPDSNQANLYRKPLSTYEIKATETVVPISIFTLAEVHLYTGFKLLSVSTDEISLIYTWKPNIHVTWTAVKEENFVKVSTEILAPFQICSDIQVYKNHGVIKERLRYSAINSLLFSSENNEAKGMGFMKLKVQLIDEMTNSLRNTFALSERNPENLIEFTKSEDPKLPNDILKTYFKEKIIKYDLDYERIERLKSWFTVKRLTLVLPITQTTDYHIFFFKTRHGDYREINLSKKGLYELMELVRSKTVQEINEKSLFEVKATTGNFNYYIFFHGCLPYVNLRFLFPHFLDNCCEKAKIEIAFWQDEISKINCNIFKGQLNRCLFNYKHVPKDLYILGYTTFAEQKVVSLLPTNHFNNFRILSNYLHQRRLVWTISNEKSSINSEDASHTLGGLVSLHLKMNPKFHISQSTQNGCIFLVSELMFRTDLAHSREIFDENNYRNLEPAFVHVVLFAPQYVMNANKKPTKINIAMEVWIQPQFGSISRTSGGPLLHNVDNFREVPIKLLSRADDFVRKHLTMVNLMKFSKQKASTRRVRNPSLIRNDSICSQSSRSIFFNNAPRVEKLFDTKFTRIGQLTNNLDIATLLKTCSTQRWLIKLPKFSSQKNVPFGSDKDLNEIFLKDLQATISLQDDYDEENEEPSPRQNFRNMPLTEEDQLGISYHILNYDPPTLDDNVHEDDRDYPHWKCFVKKLHKQNKIVVLLVPETWAKDVYIIADEDLMGRMQQNIITEELKNPSDASSEFEPQTPELNRDPIYTPNKRVRRLSQVLHVQKTSRSFVRSSSNESNDHSNANTDTDIPLPLNIPVILFEVVCPSEFDTLAQKENKSMKVHHYDQPIDDIFPDRTKSTFRRSRKNIFRQKDTTFESAPPHIKYYLEDLKLTSLRLITKIVCEKIKNNDEQCIAEQDVKDTIQYIINHRHYLTQTDPMNETDVETVSDTHSVSSNSTLGSSDENQADGLTRSHLDITNYLLSKSQNFIDAWEQEQCFWEDSQKPPHPFLTGSEYSDEILDFESVFHSAKSANLKIPLKHLKSTKSSSAVGSIYQKMLLNNYKQIEPRLDSKRFLYIEANKKNYQTKTINLLELALKIKFSIVDPQTGKVTTYRDNDFPIHDLPKSMHAIITEKMVQIRDEDFDFDEDYLVQISDLSVSLQFKIYNFNPMKNSFHNHLTFIKSNLDPIKKMLDEEILVALCRTELSVSSSYVSSLFKNYINTQEANNFTKNMSVLSQHEEESLGTSKQIIQIKPSTIRYSTVSNEKMTDRFDIQNFIGKLRSPEYISKFIDKLALNFELEFKEVPLQEVMRDEKASNLYYCLSQPGVSNSPDIYKSYCIRLVQKNSHDNRQSSIAFGSSTVSSTPKDPLISSNNTNDLFVPIAPVESNFAPIKSEELQRMSDSIISYQQNEDSDEELKQICLKHQITSHKDPTPVHMTSDDVSTTSINDTSLFWFNIDFSRKFDIKAEKQKLVTLSLFDSADKKTLDKNTFGYSLYRYILSKLEHLALSINKQLIMDQFYEVNAIHTSLLGFEDLKSLKAKQPASKTLQLKKLFTLEFQHHPSIQAGLIIAKEFTSKISERIRNFDVSRKFTGQTSTNLIFLGDNTIKVGSQSADKLGENRRRFLFKASEWILPFLDKYQSEQDLPSNLQYRLDSGDDIFYLKIEKPQSRKDSPISQAQPTPFGLRQLSRPVELENNVFRVSLFGIDNNEIIEMTRMNLNRFIRNVLYFETLKETKKKVDQNSGQIDLSELKSVINPVSDFSNKVSPKILNVSDVETKPLIFSLEIQSRKTIFPQHIRALGYFLHENMAINSIQTKVPTDILKQIYTKNRERVSLNSDKLKFPDNFSPISYIFTDTAEAAKKRYHAAKMRPRNDICISLITPIITYDNFVQKPCYKLQTNDIQEYPKFIKPSTFRNKLQEVELETVNLENSYQYTSTQSQSVSRSTNEYPTSICIHFTTWLSESKTEPYYQNKNEEFNCVQIAKKFLNLITKISLADWVLECEILESNNPFTADMTQTQVVSRRRLPSLQSMRINPIDDIQENKTPVRTTRRRNTFISHVAQPDIRPQKIIKRAYTDSYSDKKSSLYSIQSYRKERDQNLNIVLYQIPEFIKTVCRVDKFSRTYFHKNLSIFSWNVGFHAIKQFTIDFNSTLRDGYHVETTIELYKPRQNNSKWQLVPNSGKIEKIFEQLKPTKDFLVVVRSKSKLAPQDYRRHRLVMFKLVTDRREIHVHAYNILSPRQRIKKDSLNKDLSMLKNLVNNLNNKAIIIHKLALQEIGMICLSKSCISNQYRSLSKVKLSESSADHNAQLLQYFGIPQNEYIRINDPEKFRFLISKISINAHAQTSSKMYKLDQSSILKKYQKLRPDNIVYWERVFQELIYKYNSDKEVHEQLGRLWQNWKYQGGTYTNVDQLKALLKLSRLRRIQAHPIKILESTTQTSAKRKLNFESEYDKNSSKNTLSTIGRSRTVSGAEAGNLKNIKRKLLKSQPARPTYPSIPDLTDLEFKVRNNRPSPIQEDPQLTEIFRQNIKKQIFELMPKMWAVSRNVVTFNNVHIRHEKKASNSNNTDIMYLQATCSGGILITEVRLHREFLIITFYTMTYTRLRYFSDYLFRLKISNNMKSMGDDMLQKNIEKSEADNKGDLAEKYSAESKKKFVDKEFLSFASGIYSNIGIKEFVEDVQIFILSKLLKDVADEDKAETELTKLIDLHGLLEGYKFKDGKFSTLHASISVQKLKWPGFEQQNHKFCSSDIARDIVLHANKLFFQSLDGIKSSYKSLYEDMYVKIHYDACSCDEFGVLGIFNSRFKLDVYHTSLLTIKLPCVKTYVMEPEVHLYTFASSSKKTGLDTSLERDISMAETFSDSLVTRDLLLARYWRRLAVFPKTLKFNDIDAFLRISKVNGRCNKAIDNIDDPQTRKFLDRFLSMSAVLIRRFQESIIEWVQDIGAHPDSENTAIASLQFAILLEKESRTYFLTMMKNSNHIICFETVFIENERDLFDIWIIDPNHLAGSNSESSATNVEKQHHLIAIANMGLLHIWRDCVVCTNPIFSNLNLF